MKFLEKNYEYDARFVWAINRNPDLRDPQFEQGERAKASQTPENLARGTKEAKNSYEKTDDACSGHIKNARVTAENLISNLKTPNHTHREGLITLSTQEHNLGDPDAPNIPKNITSAAEQFYGKLNPSVGAKTIEQGNTDMANSIPDRTNSVGVA